jgi:hypothetical protein
MLLTPDLEGPDALTPLPLRYERQDLFEGEGEVLSKFHSSKNKFVKV